ncbi:putative aldo-keto reductase [Operophtera brumata]|uniref:Putative aldo-keto reductase n=1 Tax=Operophtera brumata TaxID=104452 RepID=A0A0L7LC85_OPEBR|nr:putative aldo-keto reductase [Operophtera brumata]
MASSMQPTVPSWQPFRLHNGQHLPSIGLGTFRIKDRDTIFLVVEAALDAGYRSFDTAAVYGNEQYIGEALEKFLPKYDLTRDDVYVTSKLTKLGFAPDLYLIHFPGSARLDPKDENNKGLRHTAWSAMAELCDTGRVSSIGVSNFTIQHLEELRKEYQNDIPYCNKHSIQLQGYHSLGGTSYSATLLKNTPFKHIADEHSVTPSQVLLTWSLQRGVAVIPKSTNSLHIKENNTLNFRLSAEQMHAINSFTAEQTGLRQHVFSLTRPELLLDRRLQLYILH